MADNIKKIDVLSNLLYAYFKMQIFSSKFKNINFPKDTPCLFATWHAPQIAFYCFKDLVKLNVLISSSNDGEIIARATEKIGINTIRGSKGRGGAQATFKIIEKLEQGESVGITVDGPKGPRNIVKKGIINIAKLSQVPIVPMVWNSNAWNFLKLPTWDEFTCPVGFIKLLLLFGEPIYVPADITEEEVEIYRQKVETGLLEIDKRIKKDFNELLKNS